MKKIYLIIIIVFASLMQSCEKFLDLKPRNKKIVSTIEDYRDIMASYMRYVKTPNRDQKPVFGSSSTMPKLDVASYLGIYTNETSINKGHPFYYDSNTDKYTAESEKILNWLTEHNDVWNKYYEFLGTINFVIIGIETAKGDNENLRNYVQGEALVWRAFSYFKLLQYYAPYKDNKYGIPVYLNPYEDMGNAMPARLTQKEVYAQIFADCNKALTLLNKTNSTNWNCAYRNDFIHAMMASIYTYKAMSGAAEDSDWSNAVKCADVAMRNRTLTSNVTEFRGIFDANNSTIEKETVSDEYYFRLADGNNGFMFNFVSAYIKGINPGINDGFVNHLFYQAFSDSDIRKEVYFDNLGNKNNKYNLYSNFSGGVLLPFRLAEMYLIKAEALLRQNDIAGSKSVLTEFLTARHKGVPPTVSDDPNKLLQNILDERIREFFIENDFRWLDMKRTGVSISRVVNGELFVLKPDDFRYSFPIPQTEIMNNKNMVQTPGWENIVFI